MTVSDPADPAPRSFAGDLFNAVRYYLGNRIGLVAIAAVVLGLGAYFNWGWLVAAGIAPILLAALPCAAMCALGLCMGGRSKNPTNELTSIRSSRDDDAEQSTLRLGASLGEDQGETDAPDQPIRAAPRNRKDCC